MRSFFIFCCLLSSVSVFSQGIEFFQGSWEEALAEAKKTEKIIFVDCYTTWCGPCKKMSSQSFTNDDLGEFHADNFISMKLDMEKEMGMEFGMKYPVSAYPTLFYIDEKGEIVKKVTGFRTAEQLVSTGNDALSKVDRTGDLKIAYDEGDRDYDLVHKYVSELNKMGKPSLKISNDYLKSNPEISEFQKYDFLLSAVVDADSRLYEMLLDGVKVLEKEYGYDLVNEKIKSACLKTVKKAIEFDYPELADEAIALYKKAYSKDASRFEIESKRFYAVSLLKFDEWENLNAKYLKKYAKKDPDAIKSIIRDMSKYFPKHPKGKVAMEKYYDSLLKIEDSSDNYFSYIRLLIENRNLSKALSITNEAIEKAQSKEEDTKRFEGMLSYINSQ